MDSKKSSWQQEPDYKAFFIMGLVWIIIGGAFMILSNNYGISGLFSIGVIFFIVGLANRDKWSKKQSIPPEQRKLTMIAVCVSVIALALGIVAFLFFV